MSSSRPSARCNLKEYAEFGFSRNMDLLSTEEVQLVRNLLSDWWDKGTFPKHPRDQQDLHLRHKIFWDLVVNERLLDVISEIVGEDILVLGTKLRCKLPGESENYVFPWHQDAAFWGLATPDAHSAWIALDDNSVENSCLLVIPGSHKSGVIDHEAPTAPNRLRHSGVLPADVIDESSAVPVEMRAGQAMIFDACLFHSSRPNISAKRRCNFLIRYISPRISASRRYSAVQLRGNDRFGHFALLDKPF